MKRIWKFVSGVRLTVWLTLAAIVLLLTGSFYVKAYKMGFAPLNHTLLQKWLHEWGYANLDKTWWFLALFVVLFLLGINTACCVLDRLVFHWKRRRQTGVFVFLVKATPSIIHASFAFMLAGHFASMSLGYRSGDMDFISRPGKTVQYTLPGNVGMRVESPECEFYSGPFDGSMRQCRIMLDFTDNRQIITGEVTMARPLFWNGYQIHMSEVPAKEPTEPFITPTFQLLVKRDPGLQLIMICFPVLIFLTLFFYIGEKILAGRKSQG